MRNDYEVDAPDYDILHGKFVGLTLKTHLTKIYQNSLISDFLLLLISLYYRQNNLLFAYHQIIIFYSN